jgi:hypothetical protein
MLTDNSQASDDRATPVIYVYAPKYVTWSAGIKALHYLCHTLNELGIKSWVAIHGPANVDEQLINPSLNTPVLDRSILDEHRALNAPTIAIYPESVAGNPLNASVTVRWILNFPGLLGGETHYLDEIVIAYSAVLSRSYAALGNDRVPVLFFPVIDLEEIDQSLTEFGNSTKGQTLLYCQKFRAIGGKPLVHGSDLLEVTRFEKKSPTHEELLKLILRAPEVIVYENSTIILEAQLLGTPVRCITNRWFDSLIAEEELGSSGVIWDDEVLFTPKSVSMRVTRERIRASLETFLEELRKNAHIWIVEASLRKPLITQLPGNSIISRHSLMRAEALFKSHGLKGVMSFGLRYMQRYWRDRNK